MIVVTTSHRLRAQPRRHVWSWRPPRRASGRRLSGRARAPARDERPGDRQQQRSSAIARPIWPSATISANVHGRVGAEVERAGDRDERRRATGTQATTRRERRRPRAGGAGAPGRQQPDVGDRDDQQRQVGVRQPDREAGGDGDRAERRDAPRSGAAARRSGGAQQRSALATAPATHDQRTRSPPRPRGRRGRGRTERRARDQPRQREQVEDRERADERQAARPPPRRAPAPIAGRSRAAPARSRRPRRRPAGSSSASASIASAQPGTQVAAELDVGARARARASPIATSSATTVDCTARPKASIVCRASVVGLVVGGVQRPLAGRRDRDRVDALARSAPPARRARTGSRAGRAA